MEQPFSANLDTFSWDLEEILSNSPLPPTPSTTLHPPSPLLLSGVAQLSIVTPSSPSPGMSSPLGPTSPNGGGQSFGLHSPTSTVYSTNITTPDSTYKGNFLPSHQRSPSSDSRPGTKRTHSGNAIDNSPDYLLHPQYTSNRPQPKIDTSGLIFTSPGQSQEQDSLMSMSDPNWDMNGDNSDEMDEDSKDPYPDGTMGGSQQASPLATKGTNFVMKLYQMMQDPLTSQYVYWSSNGSSFFIKNTEDFQRNILPNHFKHRNLSSFVRQLNMYDFHKVNKVPRSNNRGTGEAQLLEFKHVKFHRDHPDLLPEIKRKVTENQNAQHPMSAVEASPLGSQAVQDYNLNPNMPIESKFEVLSSSNSKLHTELQIVRRELKEEKDLNARYRHKTNQLVNLVKFMQDQLKDLLPGYKDAIDQANARMDASRHQQHVISRTSVVMQAPTGDLLSSTYPLNISPVDPSPPMVKVSDHDASSLGLMSDPMFNSSSTSLFSNSAQASPVIGFSPSMNSNNGMDLLRSPSNQGRRHSPSLSLGSIPQQQGLTSPVYGHHKHGSLPHANAMGIHNNPMASSSSFNPSTGHLSPTHTGHSSRGQQQGPSYGQSYPPHQTLPQYDNSVGHTNSPIGRTPKRPRKEGPNIGQFNFTGMQRGDDGGSVVDGGSNEEDVIRLTTDHHTLTRTRSASSLHSNQGDYYTPAHSPSTSISALDGEALTLGPQRSPSSINLASRPGSSAGPSSGSNSATQVPKIEETFVDVSLVTKIEQ